MEFAPFSKWLPSQSPSKLSYSGLYNDGPTTLKSVEIIQDIKQKRSIEAGIACQVFPP